MIYTLTLNPAIDRELSVPYIAFDEVLRTRAIREDYGGKGFNVSRILAGWDTESIALGFVGGYTGQKIQTGLNALGIHTDFVKISGETRTNISIVSNTQREHIKVNEPGPTIRPDEIYALQEKIRALAAGDDWWVLSGSLPPGVPDTIYADIIRILKTSRAHIILDASGAALKLGCAAGPFLAKPNAAEAGELTGIHHVQLQSADVMAAIHQMGVENVLITLGKDGALFSDGAHLWFIETPSVEEKNPIGAGDSSVAALVWGLNRGQPWSEALRWSIACGAVAAGLSGTAAPTKAQVEALMAQVHITPIGN